MIENLENFFQHFKNQSNLIFDDNPQLFQKVFDNTNSLCSWGELEFVLNTPHNYLVEIIDHNNQKLELPMIQDVSWGVRPYYNHKDLVDAVNSFKSLVVIRWEDKNLLARKICQMLDHFFLVDSSAHVYCGLGNQSKSFKLHSDVPSNFIFQIEGQTKWKVFKNKTSGLIPPGVLNDFDTSVLDLAIDTVLSPGDILYIPERCLHYAEPIGKRISVTFPCLSRRGKNIDKGYYRINY